MTDEFLTTFKNELDKIFDTGNKEESPNYWNTYTHVEGTAGFYKALRIASKVHNVTKAIYEYACKMGWEDSDSFDAQLIELMRDRGIIEEGDINKINEEHTMYLKELEEEGTIKWVDKVTYHKGYYVTVRDWVCIK